CSSDLFAFRAARFIRGASGRFSSMPGAISPIGVVSSRGSRKRSRSTRDRSKARCVRSMWRSVSTVSGATLLILALDSTMWLSVFRSLAMVRLSHIAGHTDTAPRGANFERSHDHPIDVFAGTRRLRSAQAFRGLLAERRQAGAIGLGEHLRDEFVGADRRMARRIAGAGAGRQALDHRRAVG